MVSYLPPAGPVQGNQPNPPGGGMGNTGIPPAAAAEERFRAELEQIEADERAFGAALQQRLTAERQVNEQMKLALNQPNIAGGMGQMAYGNHQWTSGPAAFARGGTVRVPAYDGGGVAIGTLHRFSTSSSSGGRNRRETWGVWNGQSWVYFGEDNAGASAFARALQSGQLPPGATSMDTGPGEQPGPETRGPDASPRGPIPSAPSPYIPDDTRPGPETRGPDASPRGPIPPPPAPVVTPYPAPVTAATPTPQVVPAAQELAAQEPPPLPPPPPPSQSPVDPNYLHPGTAYVSGRPSTTYTGDGSIAPYGAAGVGKGPTVWLGGEGNTWFEAIYDPSSGSWVDVNTARGLGLLYQASGGRRGGRPGTNTRMDGSGEVIPEPPDWDPTTGTNPVPSVPPPPPVTEPGVVRAEQPAGTGTGTGAAAGAGALPPPPAAPQQDPEYLAWVERRRREREQAEKEAAYERALGDVREVLAGPRRDPLTSRAYAKGGAVPPPPPAVKVTGAGGNAVVGEGKMKRNGHRAEVVVLPDATGVYVADRPVIATLPPGTKIIPADEGRTAQATAKKLPPAPGTPIQQTAPGRYIRAARPRQGG